MRKFSLVALLTLLSSSAHAAGGFTWVTQFGHAIGLDHVLHETAFHHYDHILTFALVLVGLLLSGFYYRALTKNMEAAVVPDKGITYRNIIEAYGSFIYTQVRAVLGEKEAPKYFPFVATIFIVIFLSSLRF